MKKRMIIVGFALVVAIVVLALIFTKGSHTFPMDANDVAQITFEIHPDDTGNFTITDNRRIEEIIGSINGLGLNKPDAKANAVLDETTFLLRCWHADGSSTAIRIIRDDVIIADGKNSREIYSADCAELVSLLKAAYWDSRNGVLE
jgi:hypothetical protein